VLVASYAERPDLAARTEEIEFFWPEFIHHARLNRHWHRLREDFLDFQLVLYDEEADSVIGRGQTVPFRWDGSLEDLPDGVEGVFDRVFEQDGGEPTTLSAVVAVVDPRHRGRGLSPLIIGGMRAVAARYELDALVAPVRPTLKARYPLTPIDRYAAWRRAGGELFDPWLRVHERLGAEILGICPGSMLVEGTVAEWEEWTELAFPDSGAYVVEGALVPIEIDRAQDTGRYVEPNVWMRHPV
jgi:GNAT superfamily N-acetyltransferase